MGNRTGNQRRGLLAALVLSIGVSGCATNPLQGGSGGGSSSGVDPRLSGNGDINFFARSGVQACLVGGLGGIVLCELTASDKDKPKCRIAAAIIGCGIGVGGDMYLDHQRSKYANKEQRLQAETAEVRAENERLSRMTSTAQQVIRDDKAELRRIQSEMKAKKMSKEQAQQELAGIDANRDYLEKTIAELKGRVGQWRQVANKERASGARIDTLNAEINKMQRQIGSLEAELDDLYRQRSAVKIA